MAQSEASAQSNYRPTPYEDASFEVVGEFTSNEEFVPMEVEVLKGDAAVADPMFQDYGGRADPSSEKRWHLPENVVYRGPRPKGNGAHEDAPEGALMTTEQEIERLKREAFEAGRAQGALETVEHQNTRLAEIEQRVIGIVTDITNQEGEHISSLARYACELAVSLSQKIIDHVVEINPDYIVSIVQEALSKTGGARVRTIKVSPQDMEFIEVVGVAKRLKEYDGSWKFEADESIRMGCVVETSAGEVDYQLDQAWERVRDEVVKVTR